MNHRGMPARILAAALSLPVICAAASGTAIGTKSSPSAVTAYGDFSNEVVSDPSGDPHVSGYSLVLYQQGDRLFGTFYATDGEVGDAPNGRIADVRFDPATKRFSFTAKLTMGSDYDAKTRSESPSHDWFEFDGQLLLPNRIVGRLVHKDGHALGNAKAWHAESVVLRHRREGYAPSDVPTSHEDWLREPQYNGPKW